VLLKCNCFLFSEFGLALNSSSHHLQEEGRDGGWERGRRGVPEVGREVLSPPTPLSPPLSALPSPLPLPSSFSPFLPFFF